MITSVIKTLSKFKPFTRWSLVGVPHVVSGSSVLSPARLAAILCILMASCHQASGATTDNFSDRVAIEQRLQQVQEELRDHASDDDRLTYELLGRLETTIYHHQAALDFLAENESKRGNAMATTRSWNGFDQPGPYSVLFSDDLRMRMIELQHFQRAAEVRLRILNQIKAAGADQLLADQSSDRQLIEVAELTDSAASRQQALDSLQQNGISLRTDVEKLAYVELRLRGVQAEIDTLQAGQELLELQLSSIKGQLEFSQSDLDKMLQRIANERRWAIDQLNSPDSASKSMERIAWLAEFLDVEEEFWNTRYSTISTTDLKERSVALGTFREMKETIGAWARVGESLVDDSLIRAEQRSQTLQIRKEFKRIKRLQYQIDFVIVELEETAGPGISFLTQLLDAVVAVWRSELYLVEDTASFEGKKVSTFRAITFGKLVMLALILIAGWLALKFLSRMLRMMATRFLGRSPASVNSIVRWNFGIGLALLIIYGLKTVNIPFTAFAFLGGTLAIGIGFGAQTLVKNFISGIILLLERPFKVGDLIEVDDVTGKILRIGMRASVIEHFDGIETLVPNSVLLDNRVDNWTFGKTAIRGSITVGVAYGSATREVSRALLAVAVKHGQILDRPEPEVRFEEFGESTLVFKILYWVDATKTQRERLDSDLRFMVDKALNEAGITLAFPQRDIHFDSSRPLQVEVASSPVQPETESTKRP